MADDNVLQAIVGKCDFFYDDALLSKEVIIKKYLTFIAGVLNPDERAIGFAFHTGSLCFDAVSVAALLIGTLAYEFSTNDDILAELEPDDMVLYKGERYKWGGIKQISFSRREPKTDYIILKQDAKGKNGPSVIQIPYEQNKHLIKPYYGNSSVTDGRGVRKDTTNRNDFISCILGIPVEEVPSTLDLSVVVVADKNEFIEICKHLKIRYGLGKTVEITDVVPVSYFTSNGEQLQIGRNPSKAEAVIKVTGKMSMARELVLDKHGNKPLGMVVTNVEFLTENSGELNDLLRRKALKFALVVAPFHSESCELAMEQYSEAKMFACTKELLSRSNHTVQAANKLTTELNGQIANILSRETQVIKIDGHWTWDSFKRVKEKLFAIKQSNWSGEGRDNFILSSIALINLFSTAFFSMKQLEDAISAGEINLSVVSPEARITELIDIANRTLSMRNQCAEITTTLLDMYTALYQSSPKQGVLLDYLRKHHREKTAIIVPKAYHVQLFNKTLQSEFPYTVCVTANRFDKSEKYDGILVTGDVVGKRFDAIQCFSAPVITLLLYEFEEKTFSFRRRKSRKAERKLNARIRGLNGTDYDRAVEAEAEEDSDVIEPTIREFSDLDDFVETMGMFDIRRLYAGSGNGGDYGSTSEVKYVGTFTTGEQILFSKFYSAVVFDQVASAVTEKPPEKLASGDVLVFTKKDDYTKNIVDQIFDQLMRMHKLNEDVQEAAEKAFYWKEALREHKEKNALKYREIAKEMKKFGSTLTEVTVRQWLIEESHIIGPRNPETMRAIAEVTQDPYILADPEGYYQACRVVRHYRRDILTLIAQAINDKLSNKEPPQGSAFEVVYENVEKLSETMELENVFELDDVAIVNNGVVNRPISESEVLI